MNFSLMPKISYLHLTEEKFIVLKYTMTDFESLHFDPCSKFCNFCIFPCKTSYIRREIYSFELQNNGFLKIHYIFVVFDLFSPEELDWSSKFVPFQFSSLTL